MKMHSFSAGGRVRLAFALVSMILGLSALATGQATPAPPVKVPAKPPIAAKPATVPIKPTQTKPPIDRRNKPQPVSVDHDPHNRPVPPGSRTEKSTSGQTVTRDHNGKVRQVCDPKRGMEIYHGLDGSRRVSVERADGSRLFIERGRPGYVQRGYHYNGHSDYARRSYYYHGRQYDRYYRGYEYRHGAYVYVYAPGYYYSPGLYGWAYNSWGPSVAYGWGWAGSPWYGYYGAYFAPYPAYSSAALWLTDYIIAANLQAAYTAAAAQASSAASPGDQQEGSAAPTATMTPEVKQLIADEVKNQLALENAEAANAIAGLDFDPYSSGIGRAVEDVKNGYVRIFVVGDGLDLVDASSGRECHVSDGDALQMQTPPPDNATSANLVVKASKGGAECAPGSTVVVNMVDLQEMQNHLRENIDAGLKDLQTQQGKGGLPQAPPSALAPPTQPRYALPQDVADLEAQSLQADQVEAEAQAAPSGPAPNSH